MIELKQLIKKFDTVKAIDNISLTIGKGSIVGIVGTNSSGKSTLLRLISGVYKAEKGDILLDDENIYENPKVKSKIFFVAEEPHFFQNSTIELMRDFYSNIYSNWSNDLFDELCNKLEVNKNKKLLGMSKGMKKRAAFILAMSSKVDYIMFDEIFDGLDAISRHIIRQIIIDEVSTRNCTIVMSSHNVSEIENLCDHVIMLNNGKLLMEEDINNNNVEMYKIKVIFPEHIPKEILSMKNIVNYNIQENVINIIVKGNKRKSLEFIYKFNPIFVQDSLLSLEEVFINEMEAEKSHDKM